MAVKRITVHCVDIEDKPGSSVTTEIDSVADVSCCGDYKHPFMAGDWDENCRIDFFDFAIMAQGWMVCSGWEDLTEITEKWLNCNYNCD